MAKVTSKLQLTIPKAIAEKYGIRPGQEVELSAAGDAIRLTPPGHGKHRRSLRERLRIFKQMVERQRVREAELDRSSREAEEPADRGWKREDLYSRGFPR